MGRDRATERVHVNVWEEFGVERDPVEEGGRVPSCPSLGGLRSGQAVHGSAEELGEVGRECVGAF